jgi:PAS domain S-box-containing protein
VLGYDLDKIMHTSLYRLIHPEDLPIFTKKRKALIKKPGASIYFEVRMKHVDGSWIWCPGIATNMLQESGVNVVVSNFRDISERKNAEHNRELNRIVLENQNKELTKTNFELDRFVYSVSHDLRSPLTSVLGLLSLIEQESHEPDTLAHA